MPGDINFADSSFDPTDEQLSRLTHEAFAPVEAETRAAMERFEEKIRRLRVRAIERAEQYRLGRLP